ncbi:AsmA family protein [Luteirhabdus pelagi]|uniref:hypothetical protein n=1 Tax=Luteirhabdus pelagi TaxID=2792783 RepID=UPI00193A854A|nr:hypothetical protein [Luteirhabdus pelagi]
MSSTVRKILIVTGILVVTALLIWIGSNIYLDQKVKTFLTESLPPHMKASYDDVSVATFSGTLTGTNLRLDISNRTNDSIHTSVDVAKLKVENLSLWRYLFQKEIHMDAIEISKPEIVYHTHKLSPRDSTQKNKAMLNLSKPIKVGKVSITDGRISMFDNAQDSLLLYSSDITIEIDSVLVTKQTLSERLPLQYKSYAVAGDSIFLKASDYENLTLENFSVSPSEASFNAIQFRTKYSRPELSRQISKERDHYSLEIPKFSILQPDFGFNNRQLYVDCNSVQINNPKLSIFRDKTVADDTSIKPLYSEMLRKLNFQLTVPKIDVQQAAIDYTEKVKADNSGGTIHFSELDIDMENVSNTYSEGTKTNLTFDGTFMGTTPMKVNWNFDVNNASDAFLFKGDVGSLPAAELNEFTEPNLKVRMEGTANQTYFTISGNRNTSQVDFKINYDDFKVSLMKDDGKGKKGLLSGLVNLFISKDSNKSTDDFRKGSAMVERDKTKSIFNFLWLNVRDGLKKAILGGQN